MCVCWHNALNILLFCFNTTLAMHCVDCNMCKNPSCNCQNRHSCSYIFVSSPRLQTIAVFINVFLTCILLQLCESRRHFSLSSFLHQLPIKGRAPDILNPDGHSRDKKTKQIKNINSLPNKNIKTNKNTN